MECEQELRIFGIDFSARLTGSTIIEFSSSTLWALKLCALCSDSFTPESVTVDCGRLFLSNYY